MSSPSIIVKPVITHYRMVEFCKKARKKVKAGRHCEYFLTEFVNDKIQTGSKAVTWPFSLPHGNSNDIKFPLLNISFLVFVSLSFFLCEVVIAASREIFISPPLRLKVPFYWVSIYYQNTAFGTEVWMNNQGHSAGRPPVRIIAQEDGCVITSSLE